jgi:hypothetical protein
MAGMTAIGHKPRFAPKRRKYTNKNNCLSSEPRCKKIDRGWPAAKMGKKMCAAIGTNGTCPRLWRSSPGYPYQSAFPGGLRREGEIGRHLRKFHLRLSYPATSDGRGERFLCRHRRDPQPWPAAIATKVLPGSATMLSRLDLFCRLERSHAAEQ